MAPLASRAELPEDAPPLAAPEAEAPVEAPAPTKDEPAAPVEPPRAALRGRVLDAGGEPVPGALLTCTEFMSGEKKAALSSQGYRAIPENDFVLAVESDAAWEYAVEGLFPGKVHVKAEAEGFFHVGGAEVDLRAGEAGWLEVRLDSLKRLRGTIRSLEDAPLAGGDASRWAEGGDFAVGPRSFHFPALAGRRTFERTDAGGRFLFLPALESGSKLVLSVRNRPEGISVPDGSRDAGWSEELSLDVGPDSKVAELRLAVERGGSIEGRVTDGDGNAIPGEVLAIYDGRSLAEWRTTDGNGRFAFASLRQGRYALEPLGRAEDLGIGNRSGFADAAGLPRPEEFFDFRFAVRNGEAARVTVDLSREALGAIEGRAAAEVLPQRASVRFGMIVGGRARESVMAFGGEVHAKGDGSFRIDGLFPGRYRIATIERGRHADRLLAAVEVEVARAHDARVSRRSRRPSLRAAAGGGRGSDLGCKRRRSGAILSRAGGRQRALGRAGRRARGADGRRVAGRTCPPRLGARARGLTGISRGPERRYRGRRRRHRAPWASPTRARHRRRGAPRIRRGACGCHRPGVRRLCWRKRHPARHPPRGSGAGEWVLSAFRPGAYKLHVSRGRKTIGQATFGVAPDARRVEATLEDE